jgi:hypothetical protein
VVVAAAVYGLTWLLGPAESDRVLLQLQELSLKASLAHLTGATLDAALLNSPLPPEFAPERFVATRRVILPLVVYSEGYSHTRTGPIGDSPEPSFVFWYGTSAVVLWRNGVWFPTRSLRQGGAAANPRSSSERAPSNNEMQLTRSAPVTAAAALAADLGVRRA